MRMHELMMVVATLGLTMGGAMAEEKPASPPTTADQSAAAAVATPDSEATPTTGYRQVDPVEAALAKAMALSQAPAPAADKPVSRRKHRDRGLTGLRKFAASAGKININAWTHSTRVPVHEPEVRMAVQPLTPDQVSTVIKANVARLEYCHQRLAARGAAPTGEVSMRFTVLPKGNPVDVQVIAGGPNADKLERCMVARIRALRFPAADAPTPVDYPLLFDDAGTDL